jgi:hypothetical protein
MKKMYSVKWGSPEMTEMKVHKVFLATVLQMPLTPALQEIGDSTSLP